MRVPASIRVLVVDDELLLRWALASTLTDQGCHVVERADAKSAMQAVAESPGAFDVIFLDYRLPDSGDLQLLTKMKQLTPTSTIMMMSAHLSHDEGEDAVRQGASAFMAKPFDLDEVWGVVQQARAAR